MKTKKIKGSLVITLKNEEKTINKLLKSILLQTKKPSEIVFVDAHSTDRTLELLEEFKYTFERNNFGKVLIYRKKGNRSMGRNFGIKKSLESIIAITDGGVVLKKDWFAKIIEPFKDSKVDVVAGFYKPLTNNIFEKCLSSYTCVMEEKVNKDFLPSSRSIAFRKSVWKSAGGYPEGLVTCEDLYFAKIMKKRGFNFFVEKKALVYWPQKKNIIEAFWQFLSYAKGDGQARYIRLGTPFLYGRFAVLFLLLASGLGLLQKFTLILILLSLYILWSILKNFRQIKNTLALIYLPLLQVASDTAVFFGMTYGFVKGLFFKPITYKNV